MGKDDRLAKLSHPSPSDTVTNDHHHYHYKHQGLDPLIRSVSTVIAVHINASSVF